MDNSTTCQVVNLASAMPQPTFHGFIGRPRQPDVARFQQACLIYPNHREGCRSLGAPAKLQQRCAPRKVHNVAYIIVIRLEYIVMFMQYRGDY